MDEHERDEYLLALMINPFRLIKKREKDILEKYYIGMKTKSVEAVAKQLYSKPEKETYPKSEEKEAA